MAAVIIGGMLAAALYLMLRRGLSKLLIGLVLLSNAVNLLVFTSGGLERLAPPLVPPGADVPPAPVVDPVPQALVLTAIVIGFGVLAFALVLVHRTYQAVGTDDLDGIISTER